MMKKNLQFPIFRNLIAISFVGFGIAVGQTVLNLLRSAFSITIIELANLLAFVTLTPAVYFAYWSYVHYVQRRTLTELGGEVRFRNWDSVRCSALGCLPGRNLVPALIRL